MRSGRKSTLTARLPALRLAHAHGVAAAAAALKSRILSFRSAISAVSAPRCSRSAASRCWRQRNEAPCATAGAAAASVAAARGVQALSGAHRERSS
eukprot:287355-Pleurochrysis_carterae.AAC.2